MKMTNGVTVRTLRNEEGNKGLYVGKESIKCLESTNCEWNSEAGGRGGGGTRLEESQVWESREASHTGERTYQAPPPPAQNASETLYSLSLSALAPGPLTS